MIFAQNLSHWNPVLFCVQIICAERGIIYGLARISTIGQGVGAQVTALTDAGAEKVFRDVASDAKTDRPRAASPGALMRLAV